MAEKAKAVSCGGIGAIHLMVNKLDGRRSTAGCICIARDRQLHDEGKYLLAQEIVNKVLQAEPQKSNRQGLAGGRFRAAWIPAGKPGPAEQLPRCRL